MLSATSPNKPVHIFRRFWEGWFSVYLSIFLVTLLVRIFLFGTNANHYPSASAHKGSKVKARQLFRASVSHIMNVSHMHVVKRNQANFGAQNELTKK